MFIDRAEIHISSGRGGDGAVSFRREKYVPAGGPDGGDGGKGGDLIFEVDEGLNTLSDFRYNRKFHAEDGERGGKSRSFGKDGKDCIVKVPPGTVIKEKETGKVVADMNYSNIREVILTGGKGGKGNHRYATSTRQAPRFAQPGQEAMEMTVILELKVIADVGLVGYPNVGKSTLLSRVTNATPRIGNYHFTTLSPNLGVVDLDGGGFVMADIPGLIEGASEGVGLGHEFLRHIERTKVIIHLVDAASTEARDPIEDIKMINTELYNYNPELAQKPQVIAANKIDAIYEEDIDEVIEKIRQAFEDDGVKIFPISAVSGQGIKELLYHVKEVLDNIDDSPIIFEKEFNVKDLVDTSLTYEIKKESENLYLVEGSKIERMLDYTNLETEQGFNYFQNFLKENKILEELEELGIKDGDIVRLYGHEFEYYK